MARKTTNIYVNVEIEFDQWIDKLRMELIKTERRHYTKSEIASDLLKKGRDILDGKYFQLNPKLDSIIEQFRHQKMNIKGKELQIDKPKIQVIEEFLYKYLESLEDDS